MEAAVTIKLGYQIPNFTYPGVPVENLFDTVAAQAKEAEQAGFDTVLVMDHFYQLPGINTPENPMLEAYTTLGALATATSSVQLSTLVTGNTYRNPALLAKTVTTLDVVSGGRAVLAIGAGWFEREHHDYGFEFGTVSERFERLEEALTIITPMLRGEEPTVAGKWYQARSAMNNPRIRPTIPVLLGGGGEKKTFRLAALFADHMNIICDLDELPRKLAALRRRCEEAGRDPQTLSVSYHATILAAQSEAEGKELLDRVHPERRKRAIAGTPEQLADGVQRELLDRGITGMTMNLLFNGHVPGVLTSVGTALAPLLRPGA
jgi:F420-dependent oxidoreductase-like protein